MAKRKKYYTDVGATGEVYFRTGVPHPVWTFRIDWKEGLGDESPWFGAYYDDFRDAESDCRRYLFQLGQLQPAYPVSVEEAIENWEAFNGE